MSGFKLNSHKREVQEAKDKAIAMALMEIGLVAERMAKAEISKPKTHADGHQRPNVITGNLRSSIDFSTDNPQETVYIGTNVEYAAFVC